MDHIQTNQVSLHGVRPLQYPTIDIDPLYIQYYFSFIVILFINFVVLYQFIREMWKIYNQDNLQNIIHDIYDKTLLHISIKYVLLSVINIIYFHDLTSPPVQIVRIFWLYCLCIVFMKFDIKQILIPALGLAFAIIVIAWFWVSVYGQLPAFKLIFIQICLIGYFGGNQAYRITKILNIYNKNKKNRAQVSLQSLLDKNTSLRRHDDYQSLGMSLQLDQHIIRHLQNRRSFCLVFCSVLIVDLIVFLNLEASKQLLGQVILSVVLDILPLYVVFWYLRKTGKQKQETNKRLSRNSQSSYQSSKRTSKIVIQMVNLKD